MTITFGSINDTVLSADSASANIRVQLHAKRMKISVWKNEFLMEGHRILRWEWATKNRPAYVSTHY